LQCVLLCSAICGVVRESMDGNAEWCILFDILMVVLHQEQLSLWSGVLVLLWGGSMFSESPPHFVRLVLSLPDVPTIIFAAASPSSFILVRLRSLKGYIYAFKLLPPTARHGPAQLCLGDVQNFCFSLKHFSFSFFSNSWNTNIISFIYIIWLRIRFFFMFLEVLMYFETY
jgi:hypothetical protein